MKAELLGNVQGPARLERGRHRTAETEMSQAGGTLQITLMSCTRPPSRVAVTDSAHRVLWSEVWVSAEALWVFLENNRIGAGRMVKRCSRPEAG